MPRGMRRDLEGALQRAVAGTICCVVVILALALSGFATLRPIATALASAIGEPSPPAELQAARVLKPERLLLEEVRAPVTIVVVNERALLRYRAPDILLEASVAPAVMGAAVAGDTDRAAPRAAPARPPTPPLLPGDSVVASVSFYYCEGGEGPRGDGGGFCGHMRDGSIVYIGAAACDHAYIGQQFRIQGDPLGLVYRCADTGSAVHGLHRDIWFHSADDGWRWQRQVGQTAVIEILP